MEIVPTREPEQWIRLRSHANRNLGVFRFLVYLCFPIVDFVLLGNWEVALHAAD